MSYCTSSAPILTMMRGGASHSADPQPTLAVAPPQGLTEPSFPSLQVFDSPVANSSRVFFNPGNQLSGVRRRSRALNGGAMEDQSGDSRAMVRIQQIQASIFASNPTLRQGSRSVGPFLVSRSQRNPTPLFGLGLIDSIPEEAIEAMAKREAKESPETLGRVSHVKDNRIGRLGWKGQVASVEDFVLNACAVELGLEVPGHHQAMTPQAPKYRTTGLDLTGDECNALVAYVKSLPKPAEYRPASAEESKVHGAGKATFTSIGCASCHARQGWECRGDLLRLVDPRHGSRFG